MAMKINIGSPDGKTHKKEFEGEVAETLVGKKIGDKVKGKDLGFDGYEFEITGGSDSAGFPMRRDVMGPARKKALLTKGVGMREKRKGLRVRKTVAGNTIHEKTAQVNLKVLKEGKEPLTPPPQTEDGDQNAESGAEGEEKKE